MSWENLIKQRFYWLALVALVPVGALGQDLRARVAAELDERGLGREALGVIGNVLAHDGQPPPRAPAMVLDVLRDPLAGADAQAIFERSVPPDVAQLTFIGIAPRPAPFFALLDAYIAEVAEAQAELMAAVAPFDAPALLDALPGGIPLDRLRALHGAVDLDVLARARALFLQSTAKFVAALRAPGMEFPAAQRFESAIGMVVIGSVGADRHASGAALIVDPGGDDLYERATARAGALSVVIDLAGDDRYTGGDVAVHALSAVVDVAGDDAYSANGAGLAAAIAGISVLVDLDGNDRYDAEVFGQGAALFGWAALVDARGHDRYRAKAFGQGFGGTGGVGLLWDMAGNDFYAGEGLPDAYAREGGIGFTQGAATGVRGELGGGLGILRDDAGDDRYESQMFAQGTGYYYALGMLWDRAGADSYHAVRYAQGNGVHEAAGVLQDESGDDRYVLAGGVGQGMGLDLAVGILIDRHGDDGYRSNYVAQGSGTANGFGLLVDDAGANSFEMGADPRSWGHAQWLRRLPTVGVFIAAGRRVRNGEPSPEYALKHEVEPAANCAAHAGAVRAVLDDPGRNLGHEALACAIAAASEDEKARIWNAMDGALEQPERPFLRPIARALREHAGPPQLMQRLSEALRSHAYCAPRAFWAEAWASAEEARAALDSPCWRLQAAALERLRSLGAQAPARASTPAFLRTD